MCRQYDAERRAAIGEKVHDNDGVELHRQDFHGHDAEMLRLLIHLLVLVSVRLIDLESGHSLQVLEKSASKLRVLVPIFCQDLLGDLLHHHDRARDQRNAQEQDQAGLQASRRRKENKQGHRRDKSVEELGYILAKIALQLVYSLHRFLYDLRGGRLLPVAHAEP